MVRPVGVIFGGSVDGHYQIDLFEDTNKTVNLYKAMDLIRNKFGDHYVRRVATWAMAQKQLVIKGILLMDDLRYCWRIDIVISVTE